MFVRNATGQMIQLSNIVSIKETVAPKDLRRFNQLRSRHIRRQSGAWLHAGPGIAGGPGDRPQEILPPTR